MSKRPIFLLVALVGILVCSLGLIRVGYGEKPVLSPRSWLCILQDAEAETVMRSGFDLVVMDYSRDGSDEARYTQKEIGEIVACGVIPICYLSIGEAEDYRFYWESSWKENPPSWLGGANPGWEGNYKARYWEEGWQRIVFSYLDRVLEQGFAGVYLDVIDAFEYWADPQNGESIRPSEELAAQWMIAFVKEIARYCREEKVRSYFNIIPQNGERILDFDTDRSYLAAISGIGVEDLWYDETEPQPQEETDCRLSYLFKIAAEGKLVLSIDYVDDGTGYRGGNLDRIRDYRARAEAAGFIPYAARTDRALDRIIRIPGLQP
ncbi:endo alpha-1,4 polygalactosaminidase [Candidatus Bipolaricaulota bacterium]|nr:endo alpha-1,4 polygalactosaminidase [Candidatus Bipolaricaulota bacterium]